ncbi:MAG: tetratricopeptide repeat protein [Verrucomicrobiota bacterium]
MKATPKATDPFAWRRDWLWGLLLLGVTMLAYQPVWHAGFIWDDDKFLTENPVLKSADGLYRLWFTTATPDYFPMTLSMLWVEWRLWGTHPLGYHLVNVLLHALSALLLWRVLRRLRIPGALLAAAIFALHPVNVESVAWITERKNTLAMFFFLGALLGYVKFEDTGGRRCYGLALGAFTLALLSKTAVAPLPVILLGMAWWRRGRVEWQDVRRSVPFFLVAALLGLVTVWFQYHRAMGGAVGAEVVRADSFWSRLAGAGWAVWFYLYKAVLPLNLIFVYPRWQIDARNMLSYIPLALLAGGLALCWRQRGTWGKGLFFGLGYFVVMLLPILGFLNIFFMRYSLVADHWQYFAIIGPVALGAAVIRKPVAAAALLLALGALTRHQCGMYADEETLWRTTLARNPGCWMAENNLGLLYGRSGEVEKSVEQFRKVLEIKPDFVETRNSLGVALAREGKVDEAIAQYRRSLETKPDYAEARNNLGAALAVTGDLAGAIAQYRRALEIKPDYTEARSNLGVALFTKGELEEAIAQYRQALEIKPDYAEARNNLGGALVKEGKLEEAIAQYRRALEIEPGNAEVQNNLGNALLLKGDLDGAWGCFKKTAAIKPGLVEAWCDLGNGFLQKGDLDAAIESYRQAITNNPRSAEACANLGLAFFQKGETSQAIACWQQALEIKPDQVDVQNNLAWSLATTPEASLRNGARAVALAARANQLNGGGDPRILRTLAAAYAETGSYGLAAVTARRALELAVEQKNDPLGSTLQKEIKLYEAGAPVREAK